MTPLSGYSIAITGKHPTYQRSIVESKLTSAGARLVPKVDARTDILLTGQRSGAKKSKEVAAEKLSIVRADLARFLRDLENFPDQCPQVLDGILNSRRVAPKKPAKAKVNREMKKLAVAGKRLMGDFAI